MRDHLVPGRRPAADGPGRPRRPAVRRVVGSPTTRTRRSTCPPVVRQLSAARGGIALPLIFFQDSRNRPSRSRRIQDDHSYINYLTLSPYHDSLRPPSRSGRRHRRRRRRGAWRRPCAARRRRVGDRGRDAASSPGWASPGDPVVAEAHHRPPIGGVAAHSGRFGIDAAMLQRVARHVEIDDDTTRPMTRRRPESRSR